MSILLLLMLLCGGAVAAPADQKPFNTKTVVDDPVTKEADIAISACSKYYDTKYLVNRGRGSFSRDKFDVVNKTKIAMHAYSVASKTAETPALRAACANVTAACTKAVAAYEALKAADVVYYADLNANTRATVDYSLGVVAEDWPVFYEGYNSYKIMSDASKASNASEAVYNEALAATDAAYKALDDAVRAAYTLKTR